jgi:glutathione S-transferase
MRLLSSPTSPFARKVRMLIMELNLASSIEILDTNPLGDASELRQLNPLGKVPTLLLDNGAPIIDSPVICDHLILQTTRYDLLPKKGIGRDQILYSQALGDGICDAAFSIVMELRRPSQQQSPLWLERWEAAILRSIAAIPAPLVSGQPTNLGDIAIAVALSYVDFRIADLDWRSDNTPLAIWHHTANQWPSMVATAPVST